MTRGTNKTGDEAAREAKARRAAQKAGYRLQKRDGLFLIVGDEHNAVVGGAGVNGEPSWTLDDVEDWLTGDAE